MTDISSDYRALSVHRDKVNADAMVAEMERDLQAQQAAQAAQKAPAAQAPSKPAPVAPVATPASPEGPGMWDSLMAKAANVKSTPLGQGNPDQIAVLDGGLGNDVLGGITEAGASIWNLGNDAVKGISKSLFDHKMEGFPLESKVESKPGAAHSLVRGVTQFALPYSGALKVAKVLPLMAKAPSWVQAMTAGAAVDFAAFSPEEGNVVNTLQSVFAQSPVMHNAFMDALKATPGSNWENRFKNAVIGAGVGVALEPVFLLAKAAKGWLGPKGADVWASVSKGKALDDAATKATAEAAPAVAAPKPPGAPTLEENIKAVQKRQKAPTGADVRANRRVEVEQTFTEPANMKKLDQWEKVIAEDATARTTKEAAIGGTAGDVPKTAYKLDGELPLIAHADDPMVHSLDHTLDDAFTASVAARDTPELLRDAGHVAALDSYSKLQQAVMETLSSRISGITGKEVKAALARARAEALPGKVATGLTTSFESLKKNQDLMEKALSDLKVRGEAQAAAKLPEGVKNPDGTLNLTSTLPGTSKGTHGLTTPGSLIDTLKGLNRGQAGSAILTAAGTAAGAAGAAEGEAEGGPTGWQQVAMAALAGFAAYKLHGGVKNFLARKGLQEVHPVVTELAHPAVAGLTAPAGATLKALPDETLTKLADAAIAGDFREMAAKVDPSDFNFEHFSTGEDVTKMIDSFSVQFAETIGKQKRGVVSLDQTKAAAKVRLDEMANALNVSPQGYEDALMASFKGMNDKVANLDDIITAQRALFVAHSNHVTDLAKVALTEGTDAAILAARQAATRQAVIQAHMKASQTEAGRALNAFKIYVGEGGDLAAHDMANTLKELGGRDDCLKLLGRIANLAGDPTALTRVAEKTWWAKTADSLWEGFVSGIFSGPATHMANMVGNTTSALMSVGERTIAAGFSTLKGRGAGDGVALGEVSAYLTGMHQGVAASLKMTHAGRASLTDAAAMFLKGDRDAAIGLVRQNADELGGFWTSLTIGDSKAFNRGSEVMTQAGRTPAISSKAWGVESDSFMGKGIDYLGSAIRTPLRLLGATDDIGRSAYYIGELHAQSYRDGLGKGLQGDELAKHVADMVDAPPKGIRESAMYAAEKGTFSAALPNGALWTQGVQQIPGMRWVIPVVKTPVNSVLWVTERMPGFRNLSDSVKADIAAGGARADIANARMAGAALLFGTFIGLTRSGLFTGGGAFNQQAENLSGPGQYSLKVGDKWYAVNRLAPIGMLMGIAADMNDIAPHLSDEDSMAVVNATLLSLARNITRQTMLAGITDATEALTQASQGNDAKLGTWLRNLGSSVVTPFSGLLKAVARDDDPYAKEVWTFVDALKSRIPGYSQEVPNKVDVLGNDMLARSGVFPSTKDSEDLGARELRRLNIDLKSNPKKLQIGEGVPPVDLTPKQYQELQRASGKLFSEALNGAVGQDGWKDVPEDSKGGLYKSDKERIIRMLQEKTRKAAHGQLLANNPDLVKKIQEVLQNRPA